MRRKTAVVLPLQLFAPVYSMMRFLPTLGAAL